MDIRGKDEIQDELVEETVPTPSAIPTSAQEAASSPEEVSIQTKAFTRKTSVISPVHADSKTILSSSFDRPEDGDTLDEPVNEVITTSSLILTSAQEAPSSAVNLSGEVLEQDEEAITRRKSETSPITTDGKIKRDRQKG